MATKLRMYRGDAPTFTFAAKNPDDTPMNLSTGTLFFTAKSHSRQPDSAAVFQKKTGEGITVTDAVNGQLSMTLQAGDTSSLYAPALLVWDLQYVSTGGNPVTLIDGTLMILPDVTRSIV